MSIQRAGDRAIRKVAVPNLSGMNRTQYQAALTAVGLMFSETSTTTSNSSLDQIINTQGTAAGTIVNIGTSISVNYYQYSYPNFSHYGGFGHYGGFYHGFYHNFSHYGSFYHGFSHYGSFYHGFGHGYVWFLSVGSKTGILTPNGPVAAEDLKVGDTLLSIDANEIDIDNFNPADWTSPVLNVNGVTETTITSITSRIVDTVASLNGELFSTTHWILSKKDNVIKFTNVSDLDTSYEVWSHSVNDWTPVTSIDIISYIDRVYSINCEPYDMFFTNTALVYDVYNSQ